MIQLLALVLILELNNPIWARNIYHDIYAYKTTDDMFNFRNFWYGNPNHRDGNYCHSLGGIFMRTTENAVVTKLFYDSSCRIPLRDADLATINASSCTQTDAYHLAYKPWGSIHNNYDSLFGNLYDLGYRYYSFAIPANCRNDTIVHFDVSPTFDQTHQIGWTTFDTVGDLEEQFVAKTEEACTTQLAAINQRIVDDQQTSAAAVVDELRALVAEPIDNIHCVDKSLL